MIAIVLGGGLLFAAGGGQTGHATNTLVASASVIRAEAAPQTGRPLGARLRVEGAQFSLYVSCDAPYWRLLCSPLPLTSDSGAVSSTTGSLSIVSSYHKPWEARRETGANAVQISSGAPVLVAEGVSTVIAPGGGVTIVPTFLIDPLLPSGEWRGDLRFTLVAEDGRTVLAEQSVRVLFNLPPIGMVLFDPGALSVRADHPGDHECDKPLRFRVISNRPSLRVRVTLPGLIRQGGNESVSVSDIAIALGSSPEDSLARLRQTPYGVGSVVITVGRGVTEQYVSVRIRATLTMPPGQYQGVLTAEVMG